MFGLLLWLGLYMCNRDKQNMRFIAFGVSIILIAIGIGTQLVSSAGETLLYYDSITALCLHLSFVIWGITLLQTYFTQNDSHQKTIVMWNRSTSMNRIVDLPLLLLYTFILLNDWVSWLRIPFVWELHIFGLTLSFFAIWELIKKLQSHGEAWLPDLLRSLDYSILFALLFSGQVALVIHIGAEWDRKMVLLLLISICASVSYQVFVSQIRTFLDKFVFATLPKLRQKRARLRMVEDAELRIDNQAEPEEMDEEEIYRHTRRALSQFGDLQRLAASPLTQLRLIDRRLRERNADDELIERAIELKTILLESIGNLKPRQEDTFGTADEWRFYNALYFPYIVGIKPYSLRYSSNKLDSASLEAYEWFRTYVPERTYYNWQNAGAKLVALMLKEKNVS
ncbi:hypothetical protein I6N90_18675 [Paenibacillus sp. GSMTC-2017]|nr:hypothetical protein [Paenibacillus sp. GSMTC-2017]